MDKLMTGFKAFDKQIDYIGTGAVVSRVQRSDFVRPFNETIMPLGNPCNPGRLQEFDLKGFVNLPPEVKAFVKQQAKDASVILYQFRHLHPPIISTQQVIHGWVVTGIDGKHLKSFYTRNTPKSRAVVDACAKLVTTEETTPEGEN